MEERKYHNDKNGIIFFFNYNENFNQNVKDIKEHLCYLNWPCININTTCFNEIKTLLNNHSLLPFDGIIYIFFFGYGYGRNLFLGSSPQNDCIHFETFCQEMDICRKRGNAMVLFTNLCFQKPDQPFKNYYSSNLRDGSLNDVFQCHILINGNVNNEGSLIMKYLLDICKEKIPLIKVSNKINQKIHENDSLKSKYYCHASMLNACCDVYFPQFRK